MIPCPQTRRKEIPYSASSICWPLTFKSYLPCLPYCFQLPSCLCTCTYFPGLLFLVLIMFLLLVCSSPDRCLAHSFTSSFTKSSLHVSSVWHRPWKIWCVDFHFASAIPNYPPGKLRFVQIIFGKGRVQTPISGISLSFLELINVFTTKSIGIALHLEARHTLFILETVFLAKFVNLSIPSFFLTILMAAPYLLS